MYVHIFSCWNTYITIFVVVVVVVVVVGEMSNAIKRLLKKRYHQVGQTHFYIIKQNKSDIINEMRGVPIWVKKNRRATKIRRCTRTRVLNSHVIRRMYIIRRSLKIFHFFEW